MTIGTRRLTTTPAGAAPAVARGTPALAADSSAASDLLEASPTAAHVEWLTHPDYTLWTDATQIDDALFGASDGARRLMPPGRPYELAS